MRVVTDSMYVHMGVLQWRHTWRANAWISSVPDARLRDHADLWRQVDAIIQSRPEGHVVTQWCKGHALPRHLSRGPDDPGLTTELNIWGNTAADGLAGLATAKVLGPKGSIPWVRDSGPLRVVED